MTWTVDSSGTQTATIGTEHTLDNPNASGTYVLAVDTNAMALGDTLELRIYDAVTGFLRQVWKGTYQHPQINIGKVSPAIQIAAGSRFTLKQTAGTGRAFPWIVRSNYTTAAAYTGPGDIVSNWAFWGGLRGYTAAYSTGSNPGVDLVDQAGANSITINILSNGNLDIASINTWVTAHSVSTILVSKLYDQTGNAKHLAQTTNSQRPALILNVLGSLPAMLTTAANSQFLSSSSTFTLAQPHSIAAVYRNSSGAVSDVFGTGGGTEFFLNGANSLNLYAGAVLSGATPSDASFHTALGIFNHPGGASASTVYVEGSSAATGDPGASAPSSASIFFALASVSAFYGGYGCQFGYHPSIIGSTNASNLSANDRAYWGF